jgi:hypothetical protein
MDIFCPEAPNDIKRKPVPRVLMLRRKLVYMKVASMLYQENRGLNKHPMVHPDKNRN